MSAPATADPLPAGVTGIVPRIAPGGRRELGLAAWVFAHAAGRRTGTAPPNVFLTLGRHRPLFRGWLRFAGKLMPGGTLPRRESELIIIRVAHVRGSRYEFDHHVHLGSKAGVSASDVDRLLQGPHADGWSDRERALLLATDALLAERDLDDARWADLRRHLDDNDCIEFLLLVGHYDMLATALTTLRVQPDRPRRTGAR